MLRGALQRSFGRLSAGVRDRPLLSAALSGVLSGGIGDGVAQWLERDGSGSGGTTHNWRRWCGVVSFSSFCSSCLYVPFYNFLDRRVGSGTSLLKIGQLVLLDDIIFVPGVEIPAYYAWTATCEGDSVAERMRQEYKATVMAGWLFNVPLTIVRTRAGCPRCCWLPLATSDEA